MKKTYPLSYYKRFTYLLFLFMALQIAGCYYYKVNTIKSDEAAEILAPKKDNKYFIIHHDKLQLALTEVEFGYTQISGSLWHPEKNVYYYESRKQKKYGQSEKNILKEVHIFLSEETEKPQLGDVSIPLDDIQKIQIIEKNQGATAFSHVATGVAIAGTIAILASTISQSGSSSSSSSSSCPFVYSHNGHEYTLEGEVYPGALMQNMERDDYLSLPSLNTVNGEYRIKMSNELEERQYTNLAKLVVVNHPKESQILLDKYGHPELINDPQVPDNIFSFKGDNLNSVLEEKDRHVFLFNEKEYSKNGVVLDFQKPATSTQGKLILNGKNTMWLEYIYASFTSQFGRRFNGWINKQGKLPSEKSNKNMVNNDFPLSIFIKEQGKWKMVDHLYTVGAIANRDLVVPLDFSKVDGEKVEIKIESGFMFWELDYVAIDFTENTELKINSLAPIYAVDNEGKDWTEALKNDDAEYMNQLQNGDVTELRYKALESNAHQAQTVFLHTKGYYELIRDYQGKPKISQLKKFKKPGYFSEYSRIQYLNILGEEKMVSNEFPN
jgi:hypothetical protein